MDHFIDQIEIKNFKSIRDLKLTGFKRINLFIGRPNVGKSNMLEALSLFSLPYVWGGSKKFTDIIRLQNLRELFHSGVINKGSGIRLSRKASPNTLESCNFSFERESGSISIITDIVKRGNAEEKSTRDHTIYRAYTNIDSKLKVSKTYVSEQARLRIVEKPRFVSIKPYIFNQSVNYKEYDTPFLYPPLGNNLLYILQLMPELRQLYARWFRDYGLRLVLDTVSQSLKIQKNSNNDEVFLLPYSSVADTLQRIIFYKTAIASNENSVLLFEEPEAHAYPPYISEFTQEVIGSKTNQTFIVTHSPLIVNDMLDNAIDDLAIFMVDFKDGQTVARPLTHDELHEVRKFGVDLFFNGESYPV
ncbi:AAA family ATPase [uncultured Fibrella sp.]|uniref:AAA family ATPase n=1 Tax=uncultured Fibrella sp. TaxID=1284596 RepID=UPI0035CB9B9A